jgi:hypothetical protein
MSTQTPTPGDPQTYGPYDFSVPSGGTGLTRTVYGGNYVIAKVNGVKQVLTSTELQNYLDNGYDVEVVSVT